MKQTDIDCDELKLNIQLLEKRKLIIETFDDQLHKEMKDTELIQDMEESFEIQIRKERILIKAKKKLVNRAMLIKI